jgi:hypothetical protein
MKKIIIFSCLSLFLLPSCTDVEEKVYDKYAASEFYNSLEGADVALAGVYSKLVETGVAWVTLVRIMVGTI